LISNLVDPRIDEGIQFFHRAHKLVEIFVSVATWDVIQRSVLRNEVEIGIAPASVHHRDPDLHYEVLFHEVYRPYCGRPHSLFGTTVDLPGDLAGYSFILTGADEPDQLTKFRQRYSLGRHVAGLSEQLEEARRLTVLGLGLCFLPETFASRDTVDGQLHPVLGPDGNPSSEILVISNPQAPPHRARDLLLENFRNVLSAA
jgi:DNA-binding transcriptional LysR family regulator